MLEVGGVIVEIEQIVRFEIGEFQDRGFSAPIRWEGVRLPRTSSSATGTQPLQDMVVADYTEDFEAGEYVVSLASSRAKPSS